MMSLFIDRLRSSSAEEKLLWLYIVLMPVINFFYFQFGGKKIVAADFVFLVMMTIFVIKCLKGRESIKINHMGLSLSVLTAAFIISFVNSGYIYSSAVELAGLIYLIALFVLVISIVTTAEKARSAINVYFFTSLGLSLFGLYVLSMSVVSGKMETNQFLSYGAIEAMAHHFPRIRLTFESPNMPLAYLHVALVCGAILFFSEKVPSRRILIGISSIVVLSAAFFTGSRRFAGLLLSVLLILQWFGRGKLAGILKCLTVIAFVIFLIAAIVTTIWVIFPVEISRNDSGSITDVKIDSSYSIHYLLPAVAVNMFRAHPFVGVGFGTFNRNFKDNVDWQWLEESFGFEAYPQYVEAVRDRTLNFDPHSAFFGTLAETGILGLLALVLFFANYIFLVNRRFRTSAAMSFENVVTGCVLAGFLGFVLNAVTLDILSMRHFWFMAALGLCFMNEGKPRKTST